VKGYHDDIEGQTIANHDFRRVLYTGKNLQLVVMTLQPATRLGRKSTPTATSSSASSRAVARSISTTPATK
jgi:hypothetical protein